MDALSETLRVVRLVGAIFINARFTAPWSYQSPCADAAAPLLEPGAERVVIFHLITEGGCYVELEGQAPLRLSAGDVVVFPQGDAHRMCSEPGLAPAAGARLDVVLSRRPRTRGGGQMGVSGVRKCAHERACASARAQVSVCAQVCLCA